MPNQKNLEEVKKLEEQLDQVQALFLANYSGLKVKDQQELRAKVKEAGGYLKVTKNTLLKIALKNKGFEVETLSEALTNQNITLFATDDPIAPLKAVVDFAKEHEKPEVKAGFLGKEVLSAVKISQLASLPSKDELIAQLMRTIRGPLSGLVNVMVAPTRNLVYALNAIKDKKSSAN